MKISNELQAIFMSTLPLLGAIILFVIVGNLGFSKISDLRNQIARAQSEKNILTQKVDILSTISSTAADLSSSVTLALPDSNTSLAAMSQLKNLAIANGMALKNIKSGSEVKDPSGLSRTDISFELSGTRDQITAFLKGVTGLAPISIVGSIKINESIGITNGAIVVRSFWAPLPKTIPSLTQGITDLTEAERETLSGIEALTPPTFATIPAQVGGKANPFTP